MLTIQLNQQEKSKILDFLRHGEYYAVASGYVLDHKTKKYTDQTLVCYTNGHISWTNEDFYNFENYDEIFDKKVIEYILCA